MTLYTHTLYVNELGTILLSDFGTDCLVAIDPTS
jgi:hypothetical protein